MQVNIWGCITERWNGTERERGEEQGWEKGRWVCCVMHENRLDCLLRGREKSVFGVWVFICVCVLQTKRTEGKLNSNSRWKCERLSGRFYVAKSWQWFWNTATHCCCCQHVYTSPCWPHSKGNERAFYVADKRRPLSLCWLSPPAASGCSDFRFDCFVQK